MARTSNRSLAHLTVVVFLGGLVACQRGPEIVTSIVFDGESRTITTVEVICTRQPDGGLVILVQDKPVRTVRIQLSQKGRLIVQKAGLRYEGMAGYVEDSREVTATKVDDTYTFDGRMPPNPGESQWHIFKVQTTCPKYVDAQPTKQSPPMGAP